MNWTKEWKVLAAITAAFLACYHLPVDLLQRSPRFTNAVWESLHLVRDYAREHILTCLVPAFFIAGAVAVFVSRDSVMRYLGAGANKVLAYGVAAVSGTILAVCSCTILPLFAGIYRMGAGLGPATAFLYSGPAINVLAIVLTARILGPELGIARAVGAVLFSVLIGLAMHFIFRGEEAAKVKAAPATPPPAERPLWKTSLLFAAMVGVLVFANFGKTDRPTGLWHAIHASKWVVTAICAAGLGAMLVLWMRVTLWKVLAVAALTLVVVLGFPMVGLDSPLPVVPFGVALVGFALVLASEPGEGGEWFGQSWFFFKQILPLLLAGVLVAGFLLGRPGEEGILPSRWIADTVGGNSLAATFCASLAGAFMYFATLTEVPILEGLIGAGMGKGPALALLLAGPALSLPNMLVIRSVMGTKKTAVFVGLVVVMATAAGFIYGNLL